jgi:hypothetical protein
MKNMLTFILTMIVMFIPAMDVLAQESVPTMVNYQGFLTDQNGTPLSGTYQITFALYSESTGAASIVWDETHDAVDVENGLFNVLLGSIDTLTVNDLHGERYLGVRVAGEAEMTPRMRIASVAYSLRAEDANTLNNKHSSAFVSVEGDTINGQLILNGNVGIGTETPVHELDVNGWIGMKGRRGYYATGLVPGDANWHSIIEGQNGLCAFEVIAVISKAGYHGITHAIAVSTFMGGAYSNNITKTAAGFWDINSGIDIQWTGTTYDVDLQVRTLVDYGQGMNIRYYVTRLY